MWTNGGGRGSGERAQARSARRRGGTHTTHPRRRPAASQIIPNPTLIPRRLATSLCRRSLKSYSLDRYLSTQLVTAWPAVVGFTALPVLRGSHPRRGAGEQAAPRGPLGPPLPHRQPRQSPDVFFPCIREKKFPSKVTNHGPSSLGPARSMAQPRSWSLPPPQSPAKQGVSQPRPPPAPATGSALFAPALSVPRRRPTETFSSRVSCWAQRPEPEGSPLAGCLVAAMDYPKNPHLQP